MAWAAVPALGQAPSGKQGRRSKHAEARPAKPSKSVTIAQTTSAPAPSQPGVAAHAGRGAGATYSNQPALLAERAKLRATDENVPQALAGWRPTVVMAGTAGYGDGMSRAFSSRLGGTRSTRRPTG